VEHDDDLAGIGADVEGEEGHDPSGSQAPEQTDPEAINASADSTNPPCSSNDQKEAEAKDDDENKVETAVSDNNGNKEPPRMLDLWAECIANAQFAIRPWQTVIVAFVLGMFMLQIIAVAVIGGHSSVSSQPMAVPGAQHMIGLLGIGSVVGLVEIVVHQYKWWTWTPSEIINQLWELVTSLAWPLAADSNSFQIQYADSSDGPEALAIAQ